MRIRIKFCGGCNPRYDRGAVAKRMQQSFPEYSFFASSDREADAVVVLCGCSSACAEVPEEYDVHRKFVMWEEAAWDRLCAFLSAAEDSQKPEGQNLST